MVPACILILVTVLSGQVVCMTIPPPPPPGDSAAGKVAGWSGQEGMSPPPYFDPGTTTPAQDPNTVTPGTEPPPGGRGAQSEGRYVTTGSIDTTTMFQQTATEQSVSGQTSADTTSKVEGETVVVVNTSLSQGQETLDAQNVTDSKYTVGIDANQGVAVFDPSSDLSPPPPHIETEAQSTSVSPEGNQQKSLVGLETESLTPEAKSLEPSPKKGSVSDVKVQLGALGSESEAGVPIAYGLSNQLNGRIQNTKSDGAVRDNSVINKHMSTGIEGEVDLNTITLDNSLASTKGHFVSMGSMVGTSKIGSAGGLNIPADVFLENPNMKSSGNSLNVKIAQDKSVGGGGVVISNMNALPEYTVSAADQPETRPPSPIVIGEDLTRSSATTDNKEITHAVYTSGLVTESTLAQSGSVASDQKVESGAGMVGTPLVADQSFATDSGTVDTSPVSTITHSSVGPETGIAQTSSATDKSLASDTGVVDVPSATDQSVGTDFGNVETPQTLDQSVGADSIIVDTPTVPPTPGQSVGGIAENAYTPSVPDHSVGTGTSTVDIPPGPDQSVGVDKGTPDVPSVPDQLGGAHTDSANIDTQAVLGQIIGLPHQTAEVDISGVPHQPGGVDVPQAPDQTGSIDVPQVQGQLEGADVHPVSDQSGTIDQQPEKTDVVGVPLIADQPGEAGISPLPDQSGADSVQSISDQTGSIDVPPVPDVIGSVDVRTSPNEIGGAEVPPVMDHTGGSQVPPVTDVTRGVDVPPVSEQIEGVDVSHVRDQTGGADVPPAPDQIGGVDVPQVPDPSTGVEFQPIEDQPRGVDVPPVPIQHAGVDFPPVPDPTGGVDLPSPPKRTGGIPVSPLLDERSAADGIAIGLGESPEQAISQGSDTRVVATSTGAVQSTTLLDTSVTVQTATDQTSIIYSDRITSSPAIKDISTSSDGRTSISRDGSVTQIASEQTTVKPGVQTPGAHVSQVVEGVTSGTSAVFEGMTSPVVTVPTTASQGDIIKDSSKDIGQEILDNQVKGNNLPVGSDTGRGQEQTGMTVEQTIDTAPVSPAAQAKRGDSTTRSKFVSPGTIQMPKEITFEADPSVKGSAQDKQGSRTTQAEAMGSIQETGTVEEDRDSIAPALESLCVNSVFIDAIGYNSYPSFCNKVVQCFQYQGRHVAVLRDCPAGYFWHQEQALCRQPAEVPCYDDPCLNFGVYTYNRTGGCASFYTCEYGISVPTCCKKGYRFDGVDCRPDPTCTDPCVTPQELENQLRYAACKFLPDEHNPYGYITMEHNGLRIRACPRGTVFSARQCGCTRVRGQSGRRRMQSCSPQFFMNFNHGFNEMSGSNMASQSDNVVINSGAAEFDGTGRITIWGYMDRELGDKFAIRLRFKRTGNKNGFQSIVSNCGMTGAATIEIAVENGNVIFLAKSKEFAETTVINKPMRRSGWNEIIYMYDGLSFRAGVNGDIEKRPLGGYLEKKSNPFLIGGCPRPGTGFVGLIDSIAIYTNCIPRDLFARGR